MNNTSAGDSNDNGPNPDVTGPGVMIGFILTGVLASIASDLCSILSVGEGPVPSWKLKIFRGLKTITADEVDDPATFWLPILERFVLSLSDQQLVTGLLLTILSLFRYVEQGPTNITIAGDLAFFSMITHTATIFTIQKMLRRHLKLAIFRLTIVFTTFTLWIAIEFVSIRQLSLIHDRIQHPLRNYGFSSTIIQLLGMMWVFWDLCLSILSTDETLRARKAMGQSFEANDEARLLLQVYIEDSRTSYGHHGGLRRRSFVSSIISRVFAKLCKIYLAAKNPYSRFFSWVTIEVIYPFRFGNVTQAILFVLGLVSLITDMAVIRLAKGWGFGQLLSVLMIILPFLSLMGAYTEARSNLTNQTRDFFQHPNFAITLDESQSAVQLQNFVAIVQCSTSGLAPPDSETEPPDQDSETEAIQNTRSRESLLGWHANRISGPARSTTW